MAPNSNLLVAWEDVVVQWSIQNLVGPAQMQIEVWDSIYGPDQREYDGPTVDVQDGSAVFALPYQVRCLGPPCQLVTEVVEFRFRN